MPEIIKTPRLELVGITPKIGAALLKGDRSLLEAEGECSVPRGWPDEHDARFLALRLRQMLDDPASEQWFARAIVLADGERPMIGHAGFHGPPKDGAVEMGYTIFADYRRHGYATEAVQGLMDWARRVHWVRQFRLSISPGNEPSLRIAGHFRFRQTGEHIDEEDGLEYEFQLGAE